MKSLSRVRLLVTPWPAAYQAPPSMGFSRQEYWSGMPLLCSDKKDHSLSPKLSLSEVQVLPKRKYIQLVAPSGRGPQLSLLRESGAQDPVGPQTSHAACIVGARSQGSLPALLGCKAGMGERFSTASRPGLMCGLGKGSGALHDIAPQPVPRPPRPQLTHWPEAR